MKLASQLALLALATFTSAVSARAQAETTDVLPAAEVGQEPRRQPSSMVGSGAPSIGTSFCTSVRNSVGQIADLSILGSAVASQDSVALHVSGLPHGSFAVFLTSRYPYTLSFPLGSSGNLCVRRDVGRFVDPGQVKLTGLAGTMTLDTTLGEWSTQSIPRTVGVYQAMLGTRSHFQLWYRDNIQGVPTSNFSDAEYVDWL
jgi:hypothetical protein